MQAIMNHFFVMDLSILLRDFVPIITFHKNWKAKLMRTLVF